MNSDNISTAADAYRTMLTEGSLVHLIVPFLGYAHEEKGIIAKAKKLGTANGFKFVSSRYNRFDKAAYVTFKGDSVKLQKWLDKWVHTEEGESVRHLGTIWDWSAGGESDVRDQI
jgi:hypothetical protein